MAAYRGLLPGAKLGVLGGGQLGRMFVHAAQRLGYETAVLDADSESPAGRVSHHHVQSGYTDAFGLNKFAGLVDAITIEFENIPSQSLEHLAAIHPVSPHAAAVAIAQNRIAEKANFGLCGIECAPYAIVASDDQIDAIDINLLPGILKTARLGYDGKGQYHVATRDELMTAWIESGNVPCVLEKKLPLLFECSVIVARGWDGQMVNFSAQRNLHRNGILAVTEVHDQNMAPDYAERAIQATKMLADELDYVGVLCVEFFVLADGTLVANEMAPRPHNSGHYTMDACDLSQFDLQARALAGMPLTQPRQHSPDVMINLLGDLWFADGYCPSRSTPRDPPWAKVLALTGVHLHLYGKTGARPGREMGHLTVTASTLSEVRSISEQVEWLLGLPGR
jgi:5-(carboxyamino)imidazole ribonucleotide synthase